MYKYFPHDNPRDEQKILIERIHTFLYDSENKASILQADPGIGKESCMTSQALLALRDGKFDKVVFIVPTDSGKINIDKELSSIGYTNYVKVYSKDILCNHMKENEKKWNDDVEMCGFEYCKLMGQRCEYKQNNNCDYYFQKERIMDAETIICDYNYIFSPLIRKHSGIEEIIEKNKVLLFVNECHKIPARMDGLYSKSVSSTVVERAIKELDDYGLYTEQVIAEKVLGLMNKITDTYSEQLYQQIDDYMVEFATKDIGSSAFESLAMSQNNLASVGQKIALDKFNNHIGIVSYTEMLGHFLNKCKIDLQYKKNNIYFLKLKNNKSTKYLGWIPYSLSTLIRYNLDLFNKFILYSGTIYPDRFRYAVGLFDTYPVEINNTIDSPYLKNRRDMIFSRGKLTSDIKTDKPTMDNVRNNVNDIINTLQYPLAIVCTRSWFKALDLKHDILKEPTTQEEVDNWIKVLSPKHDIIYFSPHGRIAQSIDLPSLKSILFISYPVMYDEITQKRRDRLMRKMKGKSGNPKFAADYLTFTIPTFQSVIQSAMRGLRNENSSIDVVYYDMRYEKYKQELNSKTLSIYNDKDKLLEAIRRR